MRRLKVIWDYHAFPLWDIASSYGERPDLPASLIDDLQTWSDRLTTVCWGKYGPESPRTPEPTDGQLQSHDEEGRVLTRRLQEAMGVAYEVIYWPESVREPSGR